MDSVDFDRYGMQRMQMQQAMIRPAIQAYLYDDGEMLNGPLSQYTTGMITFPVPELSELNKHLLLLEDV